MPTTDWNYHIREKGLDFLFPFPSTYYFVLTHLPLAFAFHLFLPSPTQKPRTHPGCSWLSSPFPSCPRRLLVRKDFNLIWSVVSSLSQHIRFTIFFILTPTFKGKNIENCIFELTRFFMLKKQTK